MTEAAAAAGQEQGFNKTTINMNLGKIFLLFWNFHFYILFFISFSFLLEKIEWKMRGKKGKEAVAGNRAAIPVQDVVWHAKGTVGGLKRETILKLQEFKFGISKWKHHYMFYDIHLLSFFVLPHELSWWLSNCCGSGQLGRRAKAVRDFKMPQIVQCRREGQD